MCLVGGFSSNIDPRVDAFFRAIDVNKLRIDINRPLKDSIPCKYDPIIGVINSIYLCLIINVLNKSSYLLFQVSHVHC